ncbi:MAG: SGNH/GDSL hydrolase family protein [Planctomycetaceae bacterium]|jgi:hypothetical protein|nr:SGNH/GDSL hydrolase family protein [Planctomycetaceae bacterium]
MTENKKIEIENETETTTQKPKQSRFKKWALNLLAVMIGFAMIGGVLGVLDILAQRELKKTGEALPKLFLYRGWKKKNTDKVFVQYRKYNEIAANDPLTGPIRNIENVFPNLVEDHLPYIIANYFKIFLQQSCLENFTVHSEMKPTVITPELLAKLERPFIVTLGGSTTDPFLPRVVKGADGNYTIVANGTWSEELTRTMDNKNIRGTVFCCGTGGYETSQDLLKLLRDVLEIKPDIVISYGGVNDLCRRRDHKMYNWFADRKNKRDAAGITTLPRSFLFPNLVRYIYIYTHTHTQASSLPKDFYFGVKSDMNEAEYMIRNWKIMQAICDLHGINFYGVLQPCVGSTERTQNDEAFVSKKWKEDYLHNDELWQNCFDVTVKNYALAKPEVAKYDFLYDFTGIFDERDLDVIYPFEFDMCHVSQEGNRIVAENMFKMLFEDEAVNKIADTKNNSTK